MVKKKTASRKPIMATVKRVRVGASTSSKKSSGKKSIKKISAVTRSEKSLRPTRGNSKRNKATTITTIHLPEVPSITKFNPYALAFTLGIMSSVWMLTLGVLGKFGVALPVVEIMQKFHLTFSLSVMGIIGGVAEGALWGSLIGFLIGWLYNKFL